MSLCTLLMLIFNSGQQLCALGRGNIYNCEITSLSRLELHIVPSSGSECGKGKGPSGRWCSTRCVRLLGAQVGNTRPGQSSESTWSLKGKCALGRIKILLRIFAT